jgi:hypothetical protein
VSLSDDGNTVAIGSRGYGNYAGRMQVYRFDGRVWTPLGTEIDGENELDYSASFRLIHCVALNLFVDNR